MRIKCDLCGKRYTLEYNGAPCPKCGQKNYSMDMGVSVDVKLAAPTTTPKAFSPHYTVSEDKASHKAISKERKQNNLQPKKKPTFGDKLRKCITVFEILSIALCLWFIFSQKEEKIEDEDIPTESSILEETYVSRNEQWIFGFEACGYNIEITELSNCYEKDAIEFAPPEGYEIVAYMYNIEVPEGDYDYYSLWQTTQIYMKTTDGVWVESLNSTYLDDMIVKDSYGLGKHISSQITNKEGIFVFLIKEGTKGPVVMDTYEGDYSYRTFEKRFIMTE